ncbi:PspC domain-containing protein [Cellulomonas edaphi]|uniref:PspC domain-containing protein n=1 Tax=Cellulomonas edaphi TaxID=3053468 RepID=A0ABT7S8J4_9CELL|nr:PspC domain-containing protein [Cellulomons edaphi]MDM7831942.1 PspC domain-containing protein [Cellulomons edaphi]
MDTNSPGGQTAGTPSPEGGAAPAPAATPGPSGGPGSSGESAASPPRPQVPSSTSGFFGAVRRLGISRADDRWIGGVCAGLANRTGYDPLLWRGIFAASFLIGGIGFLFYGVAWALLPERRDGRIHAEELLAGRFDIAIVGALAFTVIGLGRGGNVVWFWGGEPPWVGGIFHVLAGLLWFGFIAAVVVAIVVALNKRSNGRPPVPPGPYGPYPSPQPGAPGAPGQGSSAAPYASQPHAGQPHATQAYAGQAYAPQPYAGQAYAPQPSSTQPYSPYPGQPYSGAHGLGTAGSGGPATAHTVQPPYGPVPPVVAVKPPKHHKPRTYGPGVATVGIVVALGLLTLAVLLAADRTGSFDGPVVLTALGIGVVLCGLGIIVSGFRGRSSGVLGFLAIVGIVVALPIGAASPSEWSWNENGMHRFAGDVTVHVTDRTEAAEGYALGFGQAHVDVSDVPMSGELLEVPLSVGAGDLTVVVPSDAAVSADVRLRAGQVTWDVGGPTERADGLSTETRTFTDDAAANGSAQLNLRISVGAGNVTIIREDS